MSPTALGPSQYAMVDRWAEQPDAQLDVHSVELQPALDRSRRDEPPRPVVEIEIRGNAIMPIGIHMLTAREPTPLRLLLVRLHDAGGRRLDLHVGLDLGVHIRFSFFIDPDKVLSVLEVIKF